MRELGGPTIDVALPFVTQLRGLVSEPELRGLSADLRPTVPALAQLDERERPALPAGPPRRELPERGHPARGRKDKVAGQEVPGHRPVYQEAPKPLPGLAGESRSGDANGQWFRVLAAGGTNLVTFGTGVVRHDRAADPRRQPAEADQAPAAQRERAVRDAADARPAHRRPARRREQHKVDTTRAAVQGPLREGRASTAIEWLHEAVLKREGLADKLQGLRPRTRTLGQLIDKLAEGAASDRDPQAPQGNFAAIIGLSLIAAGVSVYILDNQRLRFPFVQAKPFQLKAEFSTAQAVIAGQGQTVRVSGVRIGDIGGVELKDGHAVVKMDIDPSTRTWSTPTRPRCCGPRPG